MKRFAIFHNFMDNIGGAEIVTLFLARELNATIFTTVYDMEKIKKMGFNDIKIKSIGWIPKMAPFRQQLALYKFRKLNLTNKYDFFIISGDWAMSGAVNNKPNLWYVHSPLNELWQFKDYIKNELLSWWKKPIFEVWVKINRILNLKYLKDVERIVCNSNNTKNRIEKFYNRDAKVIYPPIEFKRYKRRKSKDYWLSVNRLIKHKRIEIQLNAFKELNQENLIIVGSYEKGTKQFEEYKRFIEKNKPRNVKILSWVDDSELKRLYSECKGFIATAKDEDFGMSVIEAMASGKPVIASKEGGYKESILFGETGYLIENINSNSLKSVINKLSKELETKEDYFSKNCTKKAKEFDIKMFIEKIKNEINKKI